MSSDSASGRSNGSRLVSANPATRKTKNERKSGSANQRPRCWSPMILANVTFPLSSRIGMTLIPIATS